MRRWHRARTRGSPPSKVSIRRDRDKDRDRDYGERKETERDSEVIESSIHSAN